MKNISNVKQLTSDIRKAITNNPAYNKPSCNEINQYIKGIHHSTIEYQDTEQLLTDLKIVLNIGFENYDIVAYHFEHLAIIGHANTNKQARIFQIFMWITYYINNQKANKLWNSLPVKIQKEITKLINSYIVDHVNYILNDVIEQKPKIPTLSKSQLKYEVELTGSHYFDRSSMRFFGDTMTNYGVTKHNDIQAYELTRKRPVKHGLQNSAFFDAYSFEKLSDTEIQKRSESV